MYEDSFLEMDYEDRFLFEDECPQCGGMGCYECDPSYGDDDEYENEDWLDDEEWDGEEWEDEGY
jgi:hypothetical protein